MAFYNKTAGTDRTVIKQVVATTVIGGTVQTFTVTGALTTDDVQHGIIGDGSSLTLTSVAARISSSNTLELTLGTALALDIKIWIRRDY